MFDLADHRQSVIGKLMMVAVGMVLTATLVWASPSEIAAARGEGPGSSHSAFPGELMVVDVSAIPLDAQMTFSALQGIVNRDAPRLYLTGLRFPGPSNFDPTAQAWLDDVIDMPTHSITPTEALTTFAPYVHGLVVWDPAVKYESQDLATTLAGVEDLLPIGPDQLAQMTSLGFDVERDLRDLHLTTPRAVTEWMLDNVSPPPGGWKFPVWMGRPRNGFAVQPANRDWAVANRALVFDVDPAMDHALLARILAMFPAGTPVYGYLFFDTPMYLATHVPVNEALAVAAISEAGLRLVPTLDASNMTVHMHSDTPAQPAKWDATLRTPDADTTYVSFVVSDGDNMGYDFSTMRTLQVDLLSSTSIPIGFSIAPELSTAAPDIWNWYVNNLPDNARLVAGPSGDGYVTPMSMTDAQLDAYLERTRNTFQANGLESVWLLNPVLSPSPPPRQLAQYAQELDPAIMYSDYTPGHPVSPVVSFYGDVPAVHIAQAGRPSEIVPAIQASAALQTGPGPKFVAIGLTTWGANANHAAAAMAQLGPGYQAVAPDVFAGLLRGAAANGYTGSSDVPVAETPPVNSCSVDFDNARFADSTYVAATVPYLTFADGAPLPAIAGLRSGIPEAHVDPSGIANALAGSYASLAPLAFESPSARSVRVTASVSDASVVFEDGTTAPLGGAATTSADQDANASSHQSTLTGSREVSSHAPVTGLAATLSLTFVYDPGDGMVTSTSHVPIRCTPEIVTFPPNPTPISSTPEIVTFPPNPTPISSTPQSAPPAEAVSAEPHYTG